MSEFLNRLVETYTTINYEAIPVAAGAAVAGIVGFALFFYIGRRKAMKKKWLDEKYDGHD